MEKFQYVTLRSSMPCLCLPPRWFKVSVARRRHAVATADPLDTSLIHQVQDGSQESNS